MAAPEWRQFQATIYMYIETHCKHRRKKIYLRWAIAIDRKDHYMYSSSDPLCTDRTEQVRQTTIFKIPLTFFKQFWATKNKPTNKYLALRSIHPRQSAKRKEAGLYSRDWFISQIMPAMQLYFWERAKAACYLYVAYVRNAVAAILNLILLLRKIAIGESSIPWNRSLRAKTEDGVSGGQLPPISYSSIWRYASRTV